MTYDQLGVYSRLWLLLVFLLTPHNAHSEQGPGAFLTGKWVVVGVRLDQTLSRTPGYNINDPELLGDAIWISQAGIRTNLPEVTRCRQPIIATEKSSVDALVAQTMGRGRYSEEISNKFTLPIDSTKEVEVFWVSCKEGHFGPDTPFGPTGQNWIVKLSANKVAMRWYDNTIIVLKRVKK